ncbi:MAG: protein meaA [Actinomycetota bacterium]
MGVNHEKDRPWVIRTYAGHTNATETNALYHRNLAKGQTGLSVAFDLPTQCGYDPDHPMASGEVGKVGVPVAHMGDMRTLFDGIRLEEMTTSMTINATAMWLLSMYVAVNEEQGGQRAPLAVTTQNDLLKEFLARGTYIFPPQPSMRLITDMVTFCARELPKANPMNVCSYHLQEAGATPVQEVAFTLANALAVLDAVRATGEISDDDFGRVFGRISFFCNAGIRFIEETAKMRAFTQLWARIGRERYGVDDERFLRFRYAVQVNSLGLTAQQPENNVYRILLEALAVTLSKDARTRSLQLPAWNEALGLPRPWDQQWSLRLQQILVNETDLLEYEDLFRGSHVMEAKTTEIADAAWEELQRILDMGGSIEALEYLKRELVTSLAQRQRAIEANESTVVGVNAFTETEPSPLTSGEMIVEVDPAAEAEQAEAVVRWRKERDQTAATAALDGLKRTAESGENLVEASIAAARAGVTTGEWADALREVFGEYRAPTGVGQVPIASADSHTRLSDVRSRVEQVAKARGVGRLKILVGKPGLDGHSNGAEQIAVRARDAGFEVVYQGIRLSPAQIAQAAADEDVHIIGLSILSGGHVWLVPQVLEEMRARGLDPSQVPVVVGGIIPDVDARALMDAGVARVFTPKDFDLTAIVGDMADLVAERAG